MSPEFSCSFCGRTQKQVRKLISGPGVYICDGCIYLCLEVLGENGVTESPWDVSVPREVHRVVRVAEAAITLRADGEEDA